MNEPESFIATITTEDQDFTADLELPSSLPVSELCKQLLDVLRDMDKERFSACNHLRIDYGNRILNSDETLLTAGAFDGSRLVVLED